MKTFKKLICLLLCFIICFSLCSCNFLDEMRECQAFWGENGTIKYEGKTYKKLSQCEYFDPEIDTEKYIYVTEKDVPVMLSEGFGDLAEISKDKLFISLDSNRYDKYDDYYYTNYYAREDVYDSIENKINSLDCFDGYAFEYTAYEEDNLLEYKIAETKYKMVSKDVDDVLDFIFQYGGNAFVDAEYVINYHLTDIYQVSKDLNFKKNCGSLYNTPNGIYISTFNEYENNIYYVYSLAEQDTLKKIVEEFEMLDVSEKLTVEENSSYIY